MGPERIVAMDSTSLKSEERRVPVESGIEGQQEKGVCEIIELKGFTIFTKTILFEILEYKTYDKYL